MRSHRRAELAWLCPAWASASSGSVFFPEAPGSEALAKGIPGSNGTHSIKAAPAVVTNSHHTLKRLSGCVTNELKSWGHREPPAPLEPCAPPGTREQRGSARGFQSIPWDLTTGLLKLLPGACSSEERVDASVAEDVERFHTSQCLVFLLDPSNLFHLLFSYNKDLLRKTLKLVQEHKWHSRGTQEEGLLCASCCYHDREGKIKGNIILLGLGKARQNHETYISTEF